MNLFNAFNRPKRPATSAAPRGKTSDRDELSREMYRLLQHFARSGFLKGQNRFATVDLLRRYEELNPALAAEKAQWDTAHKGGANQ